MSSWPPSPTFTKDRVSRKKKSDCFNEEQKVGRMNKCIKEKMNKEIR